MSALISVRFPCAVCAFEIRGEYEPEDFEYPVFCPKCGRQNSLPPLDADPAAPLVVVDSPPAVESVAPPVKAIVQASPPPTPPPPPTPSHPQSERVAWRFSPPKTSPLTTPLRNCIAVDDQGRAIAAIGRELVALIPTENGCEVAWRFAAADRIPGSPVIGPGGLIFAHSSDGLLHALDAHGSAIRVPTKVGPALGWATPLADELGQVWICASTGGVLRVDAGGQAGHRLFFRNPQRLDCTGAIRHGKLYLGSEDQFLHAIDLRAERGRDLWDVRENVGLTGWYINSAIAVEDDQRVVAVSRDDHLYAFDPQGKLEWKTPLNGRVIGSPVISANGLIVIGMTMLHDQTGRQSGRLSAIHSKSGQIQWSVEFAAGLESTPVIGDADEIYVGDNSGGIHAVSLQGQTRWSESIGVGVRSAGSILPTGQVVFGLDDGSLVALKCDSQAIGAGWPKLLGNATNRAC